MVYMFPKDPCPDPHPKKPDCPEPKKPYCPPVNHNPCADDDCIEACSGEKSTYSVWPLLDNDYDKDSDCLYVTGMQPCSDLGAKIDLIDSDCDGIYDSYCYDPSCSPQLANLCPGETVTDCFTYLVSDGKGGYDTAIVYVKVHGADNGSGHVDNGGYDPTADLPGIPDMSADYASDVETSSFLPDGLSFVAIDYTSSLGANIWREDYDGNGTIDRIVYDPTDSAHLAMLKDGESTVDTVSYTMQDSAGNLYTSTVQITVYGGDTGSTNQNTNNNWTSTEFVNDISAETQYEIGNSTSSQFVISGDSSDYSWNTIDDAGDRLVVVWNNTTETPDLLYDFASLKFDDVSIDLYSDPAG